MRTPHQQKTKSSTKLIAAPAAVHSQTYAKPSSQKTTA